MTGPQRDVIARYLEVVFGYCEGFIPLRAFSEKNKDTGEKPHAIWIENNADALEKTMNFARWAHEHGMACYCIPGTVPHEEAWEYIQGYNAACVVPPWEEARLKEETNRLWKKHLARRGQPMPQVQAADALESYTLQALLADHSPMPDDLIAPRILTPGGLMVFAGAPKVGKSDFLLTLFAHLAAGIPFLGFVPSRPLRIFYLQAEVQYHYLRERLQSMQLPAEIVARAARNLITTPQVRLILNEKGVERVIAHIGKAFGDLPPDIIAIDPIRNVFDGGDDGGENDNNAMLVFLQERIEALRAAINPKAGVILVHHTRKVSKKQFEEAPFQCMSGASSLRAFYTTGVILYRPDESASELHMLFELRNGASLPTKIVEKVNGQWIETDPHHQRLVLQNYGQKLDAERIRKREVIVDILYEQAKQGKFYNPTQFAEVFENTHGLGATDTILKRISVNATKGYIKYCKDAEKYGLPKVARSKYGYLCVEGMQHGAGDDAAAVYPTHYKHAETGVLLEVENPQIWVYTEEENA